MSIVGISSSSSSSSIAAIAVVCNGATLVEGAREAGGGGVGSCATGRGPGGVDMGAGVAGATFDWSTVAGIAASVFEAGAAAGTTCTTVADGTGKCSDPTIAVWCGSAAPRPSASRTATSSWLSSARNRDRASTCGSERTNGGTRGCNKSSRLHWTSFADKNAYNEMSYKPHAPRTRHLHGHSHSPRPRLLAV